MKGGDRIEILEKRIDELEKRLDQAMHMIEKLTGERGEDGMTEEERREAYWNS